MCFTLLFAYTCLATTNTNQRLYHGGLLDVLNRYKVIRDNSKAKVLNKHENKKFSQNNFEKQVIPVDSDAEKWSRTFLPKLKLRIRKPRTANAMTTLPQTKGKLPFITNKPRLYPTIMHEKKVVAREWDALPWGRMDLSLPKLMKKLVDGLVRTDERQDLKLKSYGDVLLPTNEYLLNSPKMQEYKVKSISEALPPLKEPQSYSNQGFKNVGGGFDPNGTESLPNIFKNTGFRSSLALVQQHHDNLGLLSKLPDNSGSRSRVAVMPRRGNCCDVLVGTQNKPLPDRKQTWSNIYSRNSIPPSLHDKNRPCLDLDLLDGGIRSTRFEFGSPYGSRHYMLFDTERYPHSKSPTGSENYVRVKEPCPYDIFAPSCISEPVCVDYMSPAHHDQSVFRDSFVAAHAYYNHVRHSTEAQHRGTYVVRFNVQLSTGEQSLEQILEPGESDNMTPIHFNLISPSGIKLRRPRSSK